jgi:hypothetical protein
MTGRPFVHANRGLSWRWFIRRWHADREFYAWQDQRAHAGLTVGIGPWRVQAAVLECRRVAS